MIEPGQTEPHEPSKSQLEDLARVRRVAEVHNVTTQTVRNWAKSGMAAACQRGATPDGSALYSLAEVAKWIEMNTGKLHGGRRRGAGKKPDSVTVPAMYEVAAAEQVGSDIEIEADESLEKLLELAEAGKLPVARVAAIKEFISAKIKKLELDKALGNVVDSAEVVNVWTRYVTKWRNQLDAMVGRLAQELSVKLERPEKVGIIRAEVAAEVERVLDSIRNDSDFAVPKTSGKKESR